MFWAALPAASVDSGPTLLFKHVALVHVGAVLASVAGTPPSSLQKSCDSEHIDAPIVELRGWHNGNAHVANGNERVRDGKPQTFAWNSQESSGVELVKTELIVILIVALALVVQVAALPAAGQ